MSISTPASGLYTHSNLLVLLLRVSEVVVDTMGVDVMRVDQMGVNLYDGLCMCSYAHFDMGHACMSVIS